MVNVRMYRSDTPSQAKNLKDQSLGVHGGRLFNLLPVDLRNFEGSRDEFKTSLDDFLHDILDKPQCDGLHPDPINSSNYKNSSLQI